MTYVTTDEGWLYLATVLDAWSRRIVGWAMGERLCTDLVVDALNMAVWNRRPAMGVVHHSDRGAQYTSLAFTKRCRDAGIATSMGSVGDAYDNALAEAFFATLETELLMRAAFATRKRRGWPSSISLRPSTTRTGGTRRSATSHPQSLSGAGGSRLDLSVDASKSISPAKSGPRMRYTRFWESGEASRYPRRATMSVPAAETKKNKNLTGGGGDRGTRKRFTLHRTGAGSGYNPTAVHRHRDPRAAAARTVTQGDTLLDRPKSLQTKALALLEKVETSGIMQSTAMMPGQVQQILEFNK